MWTLDLLYRIIWKCWNWNRILTWGFVKFEDDWNYCSLLVYEPLWATGKAVSDFSSGIFVNLSEQNIRKNKGFLFLLLVNCKTHWLATLCCFSIITWPSMLQRRSTWYHSKWWIVQKKYHNNWSLRPIYLLENLKMKSL